jgi:hypothetical protein
MRRRKRIGLGQVVSLRFYWKSLERCRAHPGNPPHALAPPPRGLRLPAASAGTGGVAPAHAMKTQAPRLIRGGPFFHQVLPPVPPRDIAVLPVARDYLRVAMVWPRGQPALWIPPRPPAAKVRPKTQPTHATHIRAFLFGANRPVLSH